MLVDLGTAPPSNAYLDATQLDKAERWYPLRVRVCHGCWLVQTEDYAQRDELFASDYAYFSAVSDSWLRHAENYVEQMVQCLGLGPASRVVEVAANDGYLLQYVAPRGIACLGIEPTASTAAAARARGLEIREEFFGLACAERLVADGWSADLMVANNVLAHVPDPNDFLRGFAHALAPTGVVTFEFPHLVHLIEECQFDTIYHEHYSYLSFTAACTLMQHNGLAVHDVESLPTHGGSLRVHAQRADRGVRPRAAAVDALLMHERALGVTTARYYAGFQHRAEQIKHDFLGFLLDARRQGRLVAAYGAAAKGNTLLNFAGVRADLLRWVVDRSSAKQGRFLPGSRIPVVGEAQLWRDQPQDIVILPWNLRNEIVVQLADARGWGARFAVAMPRLEVF
jgi:SAM-dependent methyltransferase